LFVHGAANAMTDKFTHDAAPVALDVALDGAGDVYYPIPRNRLSNAFIQSVLGHVHEPLGLNTAPPHGNRAGVISNVTVVNNSYIQADDIAEVNAPVAGQPMDYLVVDGNAEMAGEFAIAQKGAAGAVLFDARG